MTFLFGVMCGVIGTVLVVYCAHNCKSVRGKVDLSAPAPAAPLYEDVAVGDTKVPGPQLELKENVAYGHVGTM